MLTLANIISHYRASASPARVLDCTHWTWLHLAPSLWESGATVRQTGGWDRRSLTSMSGTMRSDGMSFFSRVIFGHWICQRIFWVYASALNCVLSVGEGVYIHVQHTAWGIVSMEWTVAWRRKTSREVLSLGAWWRWCNWGQGVSESQDRRWSKLSLSSCSFLLMVLLCHSYPALWALGIHYTTPPLSPVTENNWQLAAKEQPKQQDVI